MPPDYTGWPTKQQAADRIGVSTKTIEEMAERGDLETTLYRRPSGGNRIRVYNPDDVERLASARRQVSAPFVLPEPLPAPIDASTPPDVDQVLRAFLQLAQLASGKLLGTDTTPGRDVNPYVALDEAARLKNLSVQTLRRAIRTRELPARKDPPRGGIWKVRLGDLEAL